MVPLRALLLKSNNLAIITFLSGKIITFAEIHYFHLFASLLMERLSRVDLERDAYLACLVHCLTTEREEVMGLLLGEVESKGHESVIRVWDAVVLRRSCKEKDRVEISPEQLASAAQEAEEVGLRIGKKTIIVGWYHSHPHITVLPSHVDLKTQESYQFMEKHFVGLIFSVFNTDQSHVGFFPSDCP